ncbi:PTS system IIA component, Fru family [Caloramator quimbayensis]|uniref:PTS system IIA component, Fru family n=1 Tax=Caloramator quimbayensis TaxID=1147123 RepID=A0A1T4WQ09_9CLOT|nr:fructose PTS transporter subunit IIA [Caloramator quimbayensis]SKA78701.1 PTS system IIA component, Fru family [Caloramator quimbayensis]
MTDLISKKMIVLDLDVSNKDEAIETLARKIQEEGRLNDFDGYIKQVKKREEEFSTAVGFDIAIPHGKCIHVKKASVAFARLKNKIKWSEDESVKYIFLLAVPDSEAGDKHLQIIAQLSRNIMRDEFRRKLEDSNEIDQIEKVLEL